MNEAKLKAIEARASKATGGKWFVAPISGCDEFAVLGDDVISDGVFVKQDADFIAHARTDVPALVAEVRRYREALAKIKFAIYTQYCTKNHMENTDYERGEIHGLIQASNIVDRYAPTFGGDADD